MGSITDTYISVGAYAINMSATAGDKMESHLSVSFIIPDMTSGAAKERSDTEFQFQN